MTLLTICEEAADAIGIPTPTKLINSTDENAKSLLVQAQIEGRELAKRHTWSKTTKEATFVSLAAESQGAFSSLGSGATDATDFDRMVPGTFWNRSKNWRIHGPLSPTEWQAKKSASVSGPYNEYRIQNDTIYLYPAPTAGDTYAFEYVSKNWCESSGGTDQSSWAADTDLGLLDENLMMLGVIWRFKKAKGFDYQDEYMIYDQSVRDTIARDGSKRTLNLSRRSGLRAGIVVPDGNWSP